MIGRLALEMTGARRPKGRRDACPLHFPNTVIVRSWQRTNGECPMERTRAGLADSDFEHWGFLRHWSFVIRHWHASFVLRISLLLLALAQARQHAEIFERRGVAPDFGASTERSELAPNELSPMGL